MNARLPLWLAALAIAPLTMAQSRTSGAQQSQSQSKTPTVPQVVTAWTAEPLLGERTVAVVDTMPDNYSLRQVTALQSPAYAATGNYGAEGMTLLWAERAATSDFFFGDALRAWLPDRYASKFYNSRMPVTFLSYNFGGGKEIAQDHLRAIFSGNINSRAQVGAFVDYIYSKGAFNYQADKDLSWGAFGSYISDRYSMQAYFHHYNFVNKENGGITDDLYITDPAEIQGGSTSVDYKTIPTNLTASHNRVVSSHLWVNNRYNTGFTRTVEEMDSTRTEFVPVTGFIWTLDYRDARHTFRNTSASEDASFWDYRYITANGTDDHTSFWSLKNTFAIELYEGFNRWAAAGLTGFITHELRHYQQTPFTITDPDQLPAGLAPMPEHMPAEKVNQSRAWAGGRLTRRNGSILNYQATARFGILGTVIGDVDIDGRIVTRIPLASDSLRVSAYGSLSNRSVPYLLKHFVSNHFIWENKFDKTRRLRIGGEIHYPRTMTRLSLAVENAQNLVYFDDQCLPAQHSGSVRLLSASLQQDLKLGILTWRNRLTYQTTSDDVVVPMPRLVIYSNMYINFRIAGVLDVQLGVDCDYYTKYRSVAYQPATMTFYNQREIECGNYPLMNAYINMKLSRTRFYVMMSHVNQGWMGSNWFSMPHYPINPRRLQMGLSIDFNN